MSARFLAAVEASNFESMMKYSIHIPNTSENYIKNLEVAANKVNFNKDEYDIFWSILKDIYPCVVDFWESFEKGTKCNINQIIISDNIEAMLLGAIYNNNFDLIIYLIDNYEFKQTIRFSQWLYECVYQLMGSDNMEDAIKIYNLLKNKFPDMFM